MRRFSLFIRLSVCWTEWDKHLDAERWSEPHTSPSAYLIQNFITTSLKAFSTLFWTVCLHIISLLSRSVFSSSLPWLSRCCCVVLFSWPAKLVRWQFMENWEQHMKMLNINILSCLFGFVSMRSIRGAATCVFRRGQQETCSSGNVSSSVGLDSLSTSAPSP